MKWTYIGAPPKKSGYYLTWADKWYRVLYYDAPINRWQTAPQYGGSYQVLCWCELPKNPEGGDA
jgi:hypothetical protein